MQCSLPLFYILDKLINFFFLLSGLQLKVCNRKIIFLFLNQNICCGYSKEPSQWDSSFEHRKHMPIIIGKKIFTTLVFLNLCYFVSANCWPDHSEWPVITDRRFNNRAGQIKKWSKCAYIMPIILVIVILVEVPITGFLYSQRGRHGLGQRAILTHLSHMEFHII